MISVERFEEELIGLDVAMPQLRSDPTGSAWLPPNLRRAAETDQRCQQILREFVEVELLMFDEATGPSDALFTARVMRALPAAERADARRRTYILASAHALAIGVAYLVLWPLYEGGSLRPWVSDAQSVLDNGADAIGVVSLVGALGLAALALMLVLPSRFGSGQLGREA